MLCGAADFFFGVAFGGMALWSLHAITFDQMMWSAFLMQVSFMPYLALVLRDTHRSFVRYRLCLRVAKETKGVEKWSASLEKLCFESVESLELMANVNLFGPLWPWRHTDCSGDEQDVLCDKLKKTQCHIVAAAGPETIDTIVEKLLDNTLEVLDCRTFNGNGIAESRLAIWAFFDGLFRTFVLNALACWLYWFDLFFWAPFSLMLGSSAYQLAKIASLGLPSALLLTGCETAGCVATSYGDLAWALEPGLFFALVHVRDHFLGRTLKAKDKFE